MAVNVSVFDLVNFPSNPKTVTVDLTELVPAGNSGEDTWVFSAITSATASGGASIQRLYLSNTKFGWIRSSGLKQGPFSITAGQKHLKVAIDEGISNAIEVELSTSASLISGEAVAKDLQSKISAAASSGGAKEGNLAYLNVAVKFSNGYFQIISGTASDRYTGVDRSSVAVADGVTTTGLASELGLDIVFSTHTIAGDPPSVTSLASNYTSGTGLTVTTAGIVSEADCVAITDGSNLEFRGVESSVGTSVTLSSGLANTYSSGSLVQVLKLQDPTGQPSPAYSNVDDVIKHAIASVANQIDFSN